MSLADALSCRKWARARALVDGLARDRPATPRAATSTASSRAHLAAEAGAPEDLASALRAMYPPAASLPDAQARTSARGGARRALSRARHVEGTSREQARPASPENAAGAWVPCMRSPLTIARGVDL